VLEDPAAEGPPSLPADDDASTEPASNDATDGPLSEDHGSPDPRVCPFLRSLDEAGVLGSPVDVPDPINRCAALRAAVPQSLRQQELVCLTSGHLNCPRYLRGSLIAGNEPEKERPARPLTPATAAALLVFATAFLLSLAFVVTNGGLEIAAAAPDPSASAGALAGGPSRTPGVAATAAPSGVPGSSQAASSSIASLTPSAAPAPTPSPTAAATPVKTPAPTAVPTAPPTPRPSSSRFALLKPCPGTPDCWIYIIRSGDNLFSIANYFGVPLATVERLNPWTKTTGLKAGRQLRLPPPTR
jgi:hypothetical protein